MFGRRFPLKPPQLAPTLRPPSAAEIKKGTGFPPNAVIWTEEAFQALQRFLRDLFQTVEGGLPEGQYEGVPTEVRAGLAGATGPPTLGWATGLHRHAIFTAQASALTPVSTSTEGASEALARADHTHDMKAVMADVLAKTYLLG